MAGFAGLFLFCRSLARNGDTMILLLYIFVKAYIIVVKEIGK